MQKLCVFLLLLASFHSFSQSFNLQSGINYFHEEKYEEASDFLTKEIQQHPAEGKAYYYLAQIHVKKETYAGGLTQANLAIKHLAQTDTLVAKAWALKGDIYLLLADTVKFESSYAKALTLFPEVPEIYLNRAGHYYSMQLYAKAMADLLQVLALDEGNLDAREYMCRIYSEEKKYDALVKEASRLIVLSPEYAEAYDYRSMGYYYLGKYDSAIADAYVAMTLDERNTRLRDNYFIYAKKNFSLAIAKLSTLINEFPNKDRLRKLRAEIYVEKKDFELAMEEFNTIFDIIPANLTSYYLGKRAEIYSEMGLHEQSIQDYSKAIEQDSTDGDYFGSRGDQYRLVGKYDLAVADFNRAIELAPEEAFYYMQRGWVKDEFQHNPEAGLADYTSAIEIDRNLAYAYLYRGRLYEKHLKDTLRSHADYRQVVALDTITGSSGNVRQYGYFGLGQVEPAKAWMIKNLIEFPSDGNYYDAACLYAQLKMPQESIAYLDTAFQKGYRDFTHLEKDDDLDPVRNLPQFKSLVAKWKLKFNPVVAKSRVAHHEDAKIVGTYIIPIKMDQGGTYDIESKVNGLPLKMMFDTGAGDISISQTEVDFMLKNGFLSKKDFIGKARYNIANGEDMIAETVLLKKVELGGLILKNVFAAVIDNPEAGMLFGQSAMGRYATITIDNLKQQIVISGKGNATKSAK
jgi:clan AA aspartic protease (TIGR02281 family)